MIYIATDNYNDGFPLSNAYDDVIYQKANAEYYLKFRFPVDRLGIWKHLTCETILKADDTRGLQLFKIKKINKINGYVRVYAKHITDDLNFIGVDNLAVSNATGRRVMEALAGSTTEQHSFIFNSDVATMHTLNLTNTTAGKVLSKDKHSILGQWGGELIRDNFLVDLKARAGVDTEILFMNKKNVKNLDNAISTENITTRLKLSVEVEGEGNNKQTINATVDSPNINAYPRIYTNYLKVNSKTITNQEQLIEYGKKYFRDTLVDFPSDNLTVNVIDRNQERVNLFDTVWFRNVEFDIDKRLKVVAYEFSPMSKRYKKISFGALKVANFGQIKSLSQLEEKIDEKITESFTDAFKIQKNLSQLLKLDRKAIEDKMLELEEKSKGAVEVKKALFEADGTIPDVVKTKILDAVEGDIGRLKTIITEAELIKAIQAKLNFAEIKNALIDKAFINQIISDETFTQQFQDGQVTTQNIFTKLKDSIKSNILKEVVTKDGVKKIVNDLTIDADGIRQITQEEITNRREELKGKSSYIHTRYSDNANGSNFDTNSNRKYIGVYAGEKQQAPTNANEYSWTKIRGEDGAQGRDGVSNYIHRKYSDNANGSPMSDNENLKYIGIYTGTSATAPTTPTSYTWSKIKGEDGRQGTPGARGSDGRTSYLHTAYSNSATGDRDFSTTNSTNKEYIGTYSDFEINDSSDYRRYKWVKIKGENGRDGADGKSINENLVPNSNFAKELKNWEMWRLINSGLNYQKGHAIQHFGRGFHIWGTPNGEYKGLGSMFDFIAKQGEKITLSMDLGKDALNSYSTLLLGVHYIGEDNTIKAQEWQQLDLATIGLELKKYKRVSKTFTVGSDMRKCRLMVCCKPQQLNNFYIDNIKLERGDTATEWCPAYEDLQGHTLTANVRFEGTYINNVTKDLKVFLDVYYDGRKIALGFNAQVKYKGGNRSDWSGFWNANVDSTGRITNIDWGNREQNGEPIDVIVLVTYKDKDAIASVRTDNTPNIGELKETIQRYKTFESTLNEFKSEIGYVKETTQILGDTVPDILKDSRTQTGNDVYFDSATPLKANTWYTIVADISGLKSKQETGIYGASGNTSKPIMNSRNFWVVKYPSEQNRVNFYPLGNNATISNVKVYEGDFTETLQGNLYVTHSINPKDNKMIFITLNKRVEGSNLVLFFDVDGDVNNKSFRYSNAISNFDPTVDVDFPLKNKDNVVSVSGFGNSAIGLIFSYANPTIKNVRVYEVDYAFRKLTKTQTQNIGTVFKQSAEDIIIAWNNYNKYFSFNNETLDIFEKDSYQNKYKKISLTSEGLKIYNNNTLIGTIGTFTHLGQSFRQNTFDIVLTENTKAFGVYAWTDTWAFDTHLVGYQPIIEIKMENGLYKTNINSITEINILHTRGLHILEGNQTHTGVSKTINVGGRNLRFVEGILVSG